MKVLLSLKPGEPGTKKLLQKYGESLIRVRYRYDKKKRVRWKTVELCIEEKSWIHPDSFVFVQVFPNRWELHDEIVQAKGFWDISQLMWTLPYKEALRLGLKDRIIEVFTPA